MKDWKQCPVCKDWFEPTGPSQETCSAHCGGQYIKQKIYIRHLGARLFGPKVPKHKTDF